MSCRQFHSTAEIVKETTFSYLLLFFFNTIPCQYLQGYSDEYLPTFLPRAMFNFHLLHYSQIWTVAPHLGSSSSGKSSVQMFKHQREYNCCHGIESQGMTTKADQYSFYTILISRNWLLCAQQYDKGTKFLAMKLNYKGIIQPVIKSSVKYLLYIVQLVYIDILLFNNILTFNHGRQKYRNSKL